MAEQLDSAALGGETQMHSVDGSAAAAWGSPTFHQQRTLWATHGVWGGGCDLVAATLTWSTLLQKQQSPLAMMTDRMKSHPTLVSFTGYQPPADEETAVQ